MASTQEMQRRAKAQRKASTFKKHLDRRKSELLSKLSESPNLAYVYLVYVNKQTKCRESFSGTFEPYQQQQYSADQTLATICLGLANKSHQSANPGELMGAISDYLALSTAVMEGLENGIQGVQLILATELDHTCSAGVKVMPAEDLYEIMKKEMSLSVEDGADISKM